MNSLWLKNTALSEAVLFSVQNREIIFYTLPHDNGGVLWLHTGRSCVCPSVVRPSVRISFLDDNLSKYQWIFSKLGICINLVEIWFGIANG